MNTKVQKWGNSIAFRIPKAYAKSIDLKEGNQVNLKIVNGKIVIEKEKKGNKYSLKSLLSQVTKNNIHNEIETGFPIGKEMW